jgi:hypothetical protein
MDRERLARALAPIAGVPFRQPYAGEDAFFKDSPHVAGMATEDNHITLNPYSSLSHDERMAVAQNEAARVWMRRPAWTPNVSLTPEQQRSFATYGSPIDQQSTVIARLISGDPSAGKATPQQLEFAQRLASALARHDMD